MDIRNIVLCLNVLNVKSGDLSNQKRKSFNRMSEFSGGFAVMDTYLYIGHMKLIIGILIIVVLGGFSCSDEAEYTNTWFGGETVLSPGVHYQSEDLGFSLSVGAIDDSRCPEGVVCVWQGEVTVELFVKMQETNKIILKSFHHPADTLGKYTFELVEVYPYPKYKQPLEYKDYRITLRMGKLP